MNIKGYLSNKRQIFYYGEGVEQTIFLTDLLTEIFNLFYRCCIEPDHAKTTSSLPQPKICEFSKRIDSKKLCFFPALRAESLCFFLVQPCSRSLQRPPDFLSSQTVFFLVASRRVLPNAGLSHHVSLLKTIFFPRASRGVIFLPDASFLASKMALPGLLFVGKPKWSNSVRGEAQVDSFCS